MVKQYNEYLRRQQLCQDEKLISAAQKLSKQRRIDFIKDHKRASKKKGQVYHKKPLNIHEIISITSAPFPEKQKQSNNLDEMNQIMSYRMALSNTKKVLGELEIMKIKNDRPADYLVEMYKSDKQMYKVRKSLTEKEVKIKEKMQDKDWSSKKNKKQRAIKKAQIKRNRKKAKLQNKRKKGKIQKRKHKSIKKIK